MSEHPDPFCYRSNGHRGRVVRWWDSELVELAGPELRITINMSRGAEILELRHVPSDADLLWHGHPDVVANRGGTPTRHLAEGNFLEHFGGGWQEVLPNAHFPVTYRGSPLGQHGEVALQPWRWHISTDLAGEVAVTAEVELRRVPLLLTRTMRLSGPYLTVEETLTNLSAAPVDVQWGHHLSLAGALLDADCELELPDGTPVHVPAATTGTGRYRAGEHTWPDIPHADGLSDRGSFVPARDGLDGHLIAGPLPVGAATLKGPRHELRMEWDVATFPYCWVWTVSHGEAEWPLWGRERIITLEPFTSPLVDLNEAIRGGTSLTLPALDSRQTHLRVSVTERTPQT